MQSLSGRKDISRATMKSRSSTIASVKHLVPPPSQGKPLVSQPSGPKSATHAYSTQSAPAQGVSQSSDEYLQRYSRQVVALLHGGSKSQTTSPVTWQA